ncbi:hypothetical protein ABIA33_006236 [Streptacidiphilus sp. MAP12-16]|uniref:DUF6542 domain-containing protein n=1 Tax=Streptacidiphilus sp. MAP12-16 TaxID=3156300 RepID=UPI0035125530
MTDSWGRPSGVDQDGAGAFPGQVPRIGYQRIGNQVAQTRGPLFADEVDEVADGHGESTEQPAQRVPERPAPGPGRAQARRTASSGAGGAGGAGRSTAVGMLVLICVPLLGAVVSGSGLGLLFTACAALGAIGAAAVVARRAQWWVVTATPAVVLLVALAARSLGGLGGSSSSAALATHMLAWTAHAFPVMAIATGAALAVVVVRAARGAREKGQERG